ncbi:MAG TPA: phosphoribosylaminoimidazolesuccinocarboxamide synthase [Acidimicrobiales bacterium]|nr:phosphoribosylaminoimidazolesuccinocarboxamide synthase [Acidimicrobiales bacterium]
MTLPLVHAGKVRELYDAGGGLLLMVASDRISAYDVVFAEPIPHKGRVLTAMTAYWCGELADVAPATVLTADPEEIAQRVPGAASLAGNGWTSIDGRALLVRRAEMLPVECIVRGYLAGQAYDEYAASGTVHGTPMPAGLRLADRLDEPMFTPSTKAEEGHDRNIGFDDAVAIVGRPAAERAREISLGLYERAAARAAAAGFVLADTKFELGVVDGELSLCDEVVTPDSSRLWPADRVVPGTTPPAFDKQPLRDWAASSGWDKRPPPPALPRQIVRETSERYVAAYERVTGRRLADWYGARP